MASFRSLLIAFLSVTVCYFLLGPPSRPTWLCFRMGKDKRASTTSVALGISLTAKYGLVSARYPDGSFEDIGRIQGTQRYLDMMRRLSLTSSSHPAPPYNNMEDMWDDQPRQWLRSARKLLYLPASAEVGVLSTLTSSLLALATHLIPSSSVGSVMISFPALPGLYAEDISDTARYLAVLLRDGNHGYPPRNTVAAYAGYDMGLCTSYTDKEQCRKEGLDLPVRSVLFVEYTSVALLLHATLMREASDLANPDMDVSTHFFSLPESRDEFARGDLVRDKVVELLRRRFKRFPGPPEPPKVITVLLVGDNDMVAVQEVICSAIKDEGFEADLHALSNPGFVAARGAAELAWRALSLARDN